MAKCGFVGSFNHFATIAGVVQVDFHKNSFFLPQFAMACAARFRSKTTEINELESVGTPRVSGHQNPTSSDGATASGSRALSGKSRKSPGP